jgi:ketopantoate reductase
VDRVFGKQRVRFEKALFLEEAEKPAGFVFLVVKSQHTEDALATRAPLLSDQGFIISLQNGLNEWRTPVLAGYPRRMKIVRFPSSPPGKGKFRVRLFSTQEA